MEPSITTNKIKLIIPNLPKFLNDTSVSVSLDYLRTFLINNKFKIKDIEYVAINWQVEYSNSKFDYDKLDKTMLESIRRIPFLVVYYNYGPSHR